MELSREPSPSEDGVPTAEEATEATEEEEEGTGTDASQPCIYTEHVFTDPLGAQPTESAASIDSNTGWENVFLSSRFFLVLMHKIFILVISSVVVENSKMKEKNRPEISYSNNHYSCKIIERLLFLNFHFVCKGSVRTVVRSYARYAQ